MDKNEAGQVKTKKTGRNHKLIQGSFGKKNYPYATDGERG